MREKTMTEELCQLAMDDTVAVTIDDSEYRGVVSYTYHEEAEYAEGVPVQGMLSIDLDLTSESIEEHGFSTGHVHIRANERRPGSWDDATASVYNPAVDDPTHYDSDEYQPLGTVHSVEVLSDD